VAGVEIVADVARYVSTIWVGLGRSIYGLKNSDCAYYRRLWRHWI
jgi:hypothetical protein